MTLGGNMKNIYEILKDFNIELPDDKKEDFDKAVLENYKTVKDYNKQTDKVTALETREKEYLADIEKRDTDLKNLNEQLGKAGTDAEALNTTKKALEDLQATYQTEKAGYEQKLADQTYSFLVKEKCSGLDFTSNSAKKAFIDELLAKKLPVEKDSLLGFEDFVKSYKETDAGAFKEPENQEPDPAKPAAPVIVTKGSTPPADPKASSFGFSFAGVRPHENK